ncbi:MAG: lytic transglycosylase domain-containing protein [Gammaproteobacteria bacterium]|nr:lytic transglycosylase domain-containing protein [Gammaproteobacteria bacterium]
MINRTLGFLLIYWLTAQAVAEVFIYSSPDGHKMISDHPVREPGYQLIVEKKTLRNVGRIMANRTQDITGHSQFKETIDAVSNRHGVDPTLVEAVIRTESSFDPMALSKKGAAGLMQLTDETANHYRVFDSLSAEENINAGVKHLSMLITRYQGRLPLVLAAYNAGETAVAKFDGVPPYPETRRYIRKVLRFHRHYWQLRYGKVAYPYQNLF